MIRKKLEKILEEINELHPEMPATTKGEPKVIKMSLGNGDFFNQAAEEVKEVMVEGVMKKLLSKPPQEVKAAMKYIEAAEGKLLTKYQQEELNRSRNIVKEWKESLKESVINEYNIDTNAKPQPSATGKSFIKLAKDVDKSKMQPDPNKLVDKDGNVKEKPKSDWEKMIEKHKNFKGGK